MRIRQVTISMLRVALKLHGVEHWQEAAHFEDHPLKIDWDVYRNLEEHGMLLVVVSEQGEELLGYGVWSISPYVHNPDVIMAENSAFYIRKSFRKQGIAQGVMKVCLQLLREKGATRVSFHTRHPSSEFLQECGFRLTDFQYTMRVN